MNTNNNEARRHSSVEVVHHSGPCSPKGPNKVDYSEVFSRDALRVASLQATVSGALLDSQISLSARSGVSLGSGNYVVSVGFGTPATTQTVTFDTGSNLNWIQCKPCTVSCYPQLEPLYDPSLSSTYRNISCTDSACIGLNDRGCFGTNCVYEVNYGDGSSTVGFLASDTLTLTPTEVFNDFVFGCGEKNLGLFKGSAGIIGLGRSPYSLNSQGAFKLGNIFSYCLPSTGSNPGYLNVGNPLSTNVVYTQMQDISRAPSLYFVDLVRISVGATEIPLEPIAFQSGGTIIDSGTVITRLPPGAYVVLRTAFREAMAQYTLAPPVSLLDTCYNFSGTPIVSYPVIKLHYSDVEVTLPAAGVFFTVSAEQVCLAFTGNSDATQVGVIGNVQQKTFEVTYDNVAKKIGFAPGACS